MLGALGADAAELAHGSGDGDDSVTFEEFETLIIRVLQKMAECEIEMEQQVNRHLLHTESAEDALNGQNHHLQP